MAEVEQFDVRKRMLFLWGVLGVAFGACAFLAFKAISTENYTLLAIVPAVVLTQVPMVIALVRLRRGDRSSK